MHNCCLRISGVVRPTPADSASSEPSAASGIGRSILIATPRALSLNVVLPSVPWHPDQPITVTERTQWWERWGLDYEAGPPRRPEHPGPGYVGDVESLPLGTSHGSQPVLGDTSTTNAERIINTLRAELRLAGRHSQVSEEQVSHVAAVASSYQAAANRNENQAAGLEAQVQLER